MSNKNPERITLKSLDEPNEVPVIHANAENFLFQVAPGIVAFQIVGRAGGGIVLAAATAVLVMLIARNFVKSAPPYCTAIDWIRILIKYARAPDEYSTATEAQLDTTNSVYAAVQTDSSTLEKTGIKRFYPPFGIVERASGDYFMVIRYNPPNLDFAPEDEFKRISSSIEEWVNDSGEFNFTFCLTGTRMDMQSYFNVLRQRSFDEDVKKNEVFRTIVEEMRRYRKQQLAANKTEQVQFYFIVSSSTDEVTSGSAKDQSASDRSMVFNALAGGSDESGAEETEEKEKKEMERKLRRRAKSIQRGIAGNINGADSEIVPVTEAAGVLESYWTGRSQRHGDNRSSDAGGDIPMSRVSTGETVDNVGEEL